MECLHHANIDAVFLREFALITVTVMGDLPAIGPQEIESSPEVNNSRDLIGVQKVMKRSFADIISNQVI